MLNVLLVSSDHTIIIGGGIVGASAAYFLAKAEREVTLIDRDAFDRAASTGNAGIIALGHPPMPRPGLVKQTFKMMFNPLNPLYIPPRVDMDLWKWMWDFRRIGCSREQFEYSMRVLADIGWRAGECFDRLVDEESLGCEYRRTGWIEVFRDEVKFEQGREEAAMVREHGYNAEELTSDQLMQREGAFLPGVVGAVHYTDSRFANPQRALKEIANRAARHGANILTRTEVSEILHRDRRFTGVRLSTGKAIQGDTLVLAGGIWSSQLARSLGINIPMQPGKGYHINIDAPAGSKPSTVCVLSEAFVAVTPLEAGLRLAGTVELSGINERMVRKRLDMLRIGASRYLRGIDDAATISEWCGLRPCTADGLPIIGWADEMDNVFLATGHAMMGFALGPITGQLAAESIVEGEPSYDLAPFSPSRYRRGSRHRQRSKASIAVTAREV